jgi:hypothetical protein|uniref:Uncharacterized protein n=1 Tax=Sipha flava TaxID=143950 RepID=A0A2S2PZC9_9HEMI
MHCRHGVAERRHGAVKNNNTAAWRVKKKKKTRNPEQPREYCVVRTSEKPARAERDRDTLTHTQHRARSEPRPPRHQSVTYAPSEAIAMQHGGRCRRYRRSSSSSYCCYYCCCFPNAADSVDLFVRDAFVHSGNVMMTSERRRHRRPDFSATETAPPSPCQIII